MGNVGMPELVVLFTIGLMGLVVVWPAVRICRRAGFPGWLGAIALLPVANVLLMWFLAWAPWPAMKSSS